MLTLHALALCAALTAASPDPVLLHFSADWCAPCKEMEPIVRRLESSGFPIRHVNVDQERSLAEQFQVSGVPCFILFANGRVVDRVEGKTSYDRLAKMFSPTSETIIRGQDPAARNSAIPSLGRFGSLFPQNGSSSNPTPTSSAEPQAASRDPFAPRSAVPPLGTATEPRSLENPKQRALHATVRLRIEDPKGHSIGSGTIIDTHGDEALAITCGHVFRDSKGNGVIHVDLFLPQGERTVPGKLIDYDLPRDIGLVSFKPGVRVTPMAVADGRVKLAKGERVFSVGCDKGGSPRFLESQVTHINKYLGPANIEVAGQPSDGRSGGGLFSSTGELIGVCNAADPAEKEGIYAALDNVHWQLNRIGMRRLFERGSSTPEQAIAANAPRVPDTRPTEPKSLEPRLPTTEVALQASRNPNATMTPAAFGSSPAIGNSPAFGAPPANVTSTGVPSAPLQPAGLQPVGMSPVGMPPATAIPATASTLAAATTAATNLPAAKSDDMEIICIIRSRTNPNGKSEVLMLDRASPDLLERLTRESRPVTMPQGTRSLSGPNSAGGMSADPYLRDAGSDRSSVIRGQNIR